MYSNEATTYSQHLSSLKIAAVQYYIFQDKFLFIYSFFFALILDRNLYSHRVPMLIYSLHSPSSARDQCQSTAFASRLQHVIKRLLHLKLSLFLSRASKGWCHYLHADGGYCCLDPFWRLQGKSITSTASAAVTIATHQWRAATTSSDNGGSNVGR